MQDVSRKVSFMKCETGHSLSGSLSMSEREENTARNLLVHSCILPHGREQQSLAIQK